MNRLKTILFATLTALAALPGAASEPTDRVRQYTYDAAGNITQISSDVYVYDGVSRVVSGTVSGRERLYQYDAFGNRTRCTDVDSDSTCQWGANIASALNRVIGADYDAAGNLRSYSGQTYQYDSEGMMTSRNEGATEYIYTADDERIAIVTGAAWKWTLRDASGKVLRELASTAGPDGTHSNWHWTRDHVFRNGTLLSSVDPSGTRHYHVDHLGTPRVVSDATGHIAAHDYFAFGLELNDNLSEPNPANLRFTGHERDADGLDYMHARFYEPKWGRFLSVDPVLGREAEPQSWNRYAYVLNNPVRSVDPDGREDKDAIRKWTFTDSMRNPETARARYTIDKSSYGPKIEFEKAGINVTAAYEVDWANGTTAAEIKVASGDVGFSVHSDSNAQNGATVNTLWSETKLGDEKPKGEKFKRTGPKIFEVIAGDGGLVGFSVNVLAFSTTKGIRFQTILKDIQADITATAKRWAEAKPQVLPQKQESAPRQ